MARWNTNTRHSAEIYQELCGAYTLSVVEDAAFEFKRIPYALGASCVYLLETSGSSLVNSLSKIDRVKVKIELPRPQTKKLKKDGVSKKRHLSNGKPTASDKLLEYWMTVEALDFSHPQWLEGFSFMTVRHGESVQQVGEKKRDALFRLTPESGYYRCAEGNLHVINKGRLSEVLTENDHVHSLEY